ncbi:vesicle coat component [Kalmusia sp. IMI 367209]|nr:vesicle coat component [Kalmusia sp. IMI 367209]
MESRVAPGQRSQREPTLQPSPQIIPQSKPVLEDGQEDDEDDVPIIPTTDATSAHLSNGVPDRAHISGDDYFGRYEEADSSENSQSSTSEADAPGDNDSEDDALTAAAGRLSLGNKAEEGKHGETNGVLSVIPIATEGHNAAFEEEFPEENYEHQSEKTLLEEAVAESENAPLVADTEPATDDWGASGEVFDLGGMPQDAPVETPLQAPPDTPHPEAGGTTVGDKVIGNTNVGGNTGENTDDWGNGEGDDFFGGVTHSQALESAQPAGESAGAHVVKNPGGEAATGSDSMWDLDLDMDDDFLPDTEEAAPLFEIDDDEGFLEEEPSTASQRPVQPVSAPSTNRYAPATTQAPQPQTNSYGVPTPQLTNFAQPNQTPATPTPSAIYGAYGQPSPYQQAPVRPSLPSSTESFASKAREGYHSPYDLPEDIVTTRRRAAPRTTSAPITQPSAPPRTSSMSSTGPTRPLPPSNMSATSLSPPSSGHSMQAQLSGMPSNVPPKPATPARAPLNDFFAELPVTSRPRASGKYTPQHGAPQQPPAHGFPPKERTASWSSLRNEFRPDSDNLISQLQQPERLPVFPDQPTAPVRTNSLPVPQPAPAPSSRYSPAPPSAPAPNTRYSPAPPSAPAANTRYSPAPPPSQGPAASTSSQYTSPSLNGPPRPPSQNYAPRTSSPLAYHTLPQQAEEPAHVHQHATDEPNALPSIDSVPRAAFKSPLEGVMEEQTQQQAAAPPMTARSETPPLRSGPSSAVSSPRKRNNYAPQYQSTTPSMAPVPTRAQTQSPSAPMKQPHRSFSNAGPLGLAHVSAFQPSYGASSAQNVNTIPPRRQASLQYESIAPTDERAADPLERWRGHPVFKWGLGGTVVTTFPKQVPRYGGGGSAPMVKCSPGEIRIQSVKETLPLAEDIVKFPGPLKSKSKKKDVSAWLAQRIGTLEVQLQAPGLDQSLSTDELKRLEEKVLLWKVLQVFVDNDGHLDGNATVDAAVRKIFSPETDSSTSDDLSLTTAADLVGRPRSNTTGVQADPVDPRAVEELRTLLTKGDREKAVWHAVDQRLWAHAMLLSSTLNKDVWKQVVQEFVQKEVKKLGGNNQALAVLYEIFAGNHDDCIDELVPASARAGFQMMSTDGAGSTQNALQGLDKWRETLSLVLNNRSDGDSAALVSLGKLLAGYGRVEAAHICFIFARSKAHLNGVDDPEAHIVLIGADHKQNPLDLGIDLEPVLLTEVYEFGLSLSAQGGSHIIPHLQNYKLAHAYQLAEYGHRADAQAYCDAIAASMKATTRISPYYNGSFVAMLDDLSKRMSQSSKDGSSSWISKPSMDKVSSSLLSKFNSFIAGDEEDAASNHSAGEAGPFAKIAGTPPTLSPVQSSADLYGAYSGFGISAAASSAPTNSRYAPSNAYAPRTSIESTRSKYEPQGRPSLESNDGNTGMRAVSDSYLPSPQLPNSFTPSQSQLSPAAPSLAKSHSYSPLRSEYNASEPSYGNPYQPAPAGEPVPAFGGFQPLQANFDDAPIEASGFQPPSSSYEPPSYQPYQPEENDSPKQSLKPKKSFMDLDDDDDDIAARAAALKTKGKSEADRQADEAFRKAAEEDAKRDKEAAAKKSGGWFGGWFKKEDSLAPKPIKAMLGEENSFKYDPELKKWVNTKGGATETSKPIATPPPPRSGPPSRSVSNQSPMGPPSSLPNGGGLAAPPPTSDPTQRSSSMPPPMGIPGSRASTPGIPSDSEGPKPPTLVRPSLPGGPPSRPGTGMSTASSIDDLLGAPQARKGAGAKKKKSGRYVDVMAKP